MFVLCEHLVDLVVQVGARFQLKCKLRTSTVNDGLTNLHRFAVRIAPNVASSWLSWMSILMTCTICPLLSSRDIISSTTCNVIEREFQGTWKSWKIKVPDHKPSPPCRWLRQTRDDTIETSPVRSWFVCSSRACRRYRWTCTWWSGNVQYTICTPTWEELSVQLTAPGPCWVNRQEFVCTAYRIRKYLVYRRQHRGVWHANHYRNSPLWNPSS